jgi:hypothetical protein
LQKISKTKFHIRPQTISLTNVCWLVVYWNWFWILVFCLFVCRHLRVIITFDVEHKSRSSQLCNFPQFFLSCPLLKNTPTSSHPTWVRIPPGSWKFVCECCVLSGRSLFDELVTHPEESYRLCCVLVVWSRNLVNVEVVAHLEGLSCHKQNILLIITILSAMKTTSLILGRLCSFCRGLGRTSLPFLWFWLVIFHLDFLRCQSATLIPKLFHVTLLSESTEQCWFLLLYQALLLHLYLESWCLCINWEC